MTDRTDESVPAPQPPHPLPEQSTTPAESPPSDDERREMERADRANGEPDADDGGPGSDG